LLSRDRQTDRPRQIDTHLDLKEKCGREYAKISTTYTKFLWESRSLQTEYEEARLSVREYVRMNRKEREYVRLKWKEPRICTYEF
jgi:hypothetical protein